MPNISNSLLENLPDWVPLTKESDRKAETKTICQQVYKNTKVLTGVTNDEQLEEMMVVFSRHSSVQNVSS